MRPALAFCIALLWLIAAHAQAQEVKRISRAEAVSAATLKVQPEYPLIARQLKLEGVVELEATIDESGAVAGVRELNGNPVLARAAVRAIEKWKFAPFHISGKPARVVAPLSFSFAK
jgi:TonB family protein